MPKHTLDQKAGTFTAACMYNAGTFTAAYTYAACMYAACMYAYTTCIHAYTHTHTRTNFPHYIYPYIHILHHTTCTQRYLLDGPVIHVSIHDMFTYVRDKYAYA